MEAKAECDVIEIAKTYGRKLLYMGNINVVTLRTNDLEQIEEEIVPKYKRAKTNENPPYFFHSDHSIPPNINLKTYQYALQLFYENSYY